METLRTVAKAGHVIAVDLERRRIEADDLPPIPFDVADDRREALLKGWNDTTRILALHEAEITAFEVAQRRAAPWLWNKRN